MISLVTNMESKLMAQIVALRDQLKAYTDQRAQEEVRIFLY